MAWEAELLPHRRPPPRVPPYTLGGFSPESPKVLFDQLDSLAPLSGPRWGLAIGLVGRVERAETSALWNPAGSVGSSVAPAL
jgi:hypothetical protein